MLSSPDFIIVYFEDPKESEKQKGFSKGADYAISKWQPVTFLYPRTNTVTT